MRNTVGSCLPGQLPSLAPTDYLFPPTRGQLAGADVAAEGCAGLLLVGVLTFLLALGFDQLGWPWALGAVVGFVGFSYWVFTDVKKSRNGRGMQRRMQHLEARVSELENRLQSASAAAKLPSDQVQAGVTVGSCPGRHEPTVFLIPNLCQARSRVPPFSLPRITH